RWFKLPSGQPDGGWEFPRGPGRNHHALALSPDGKTLLYGGAADKGAERPYLLDARTGQVVREFPAGSFLTHIGSMSDDARVAAADAAELREKWSAATEPKTGLVRFDRAGRFVVYSHRGELAAEPFDARTGAAGPKWAGGATGSWLPLPMDGSKFAFVPHDAGPVRVWDAAAN